VISRELLRHVKRIEITTTRLVEDLFGGEYESVFKGQGIEFADVREYVPGDDIRTIDWNVTARSQTTFVKQYVEERELSVLFVVDASSSCYFGSTAKIKSEIMAEICALLAFAAVKNHDKVGLSFFSDHVEKYVPLKKGKKHVLRVIREILSFHPENRRTLFDAAFEFAVRVLTHRAIVFVVSDFLDFPETSNALRILARKHDIIAIRITDPREIGLVSAGWMELEDAETGEILTVPAGDRRFRDAFERLARERSEKVDKIFRTVGIDKIDIDTSQSYVEPIIRFFRAREKRAR
jgi:uncharacterized protein (DUF58 family)